MILKGCAKMHIAHGEQIERKMFDIHSHIVPAIDDGSINMNMSIEMLRAAYSQGARDIICTFHSGYHINKYQLVADEGKMLTKDGKTFTNVVMTNDDELDLWYEVGQE